MRVTFKLLVMSGLVACAWTLSGCATPPPASDKDALEEFRQTNDPLEPANRNTFAVNDAIDSAVLEPVARGYRAAVPPPVRDGIHNVLANLGSPVLLANDMMQGKPKRAGDSLMRFLINSTVGLAGVIDVASSWGYPAHDTGFGTTLALWGVDEGPFLMLPVLGPSNPRDAAGFGADVVADPLSWVSGGTALTIADWGRFGLNTVDQRERNLDPVAEIKKTALDPYATIRSLYRQHREAEIGDTRADNRHTIPVWFDQPAN